MRTLNFLSKPTIARVNGSAYGGGVGLVACCDIAIGVEGAKFSLSEVKLGLVPAVISPYVIAAIGAAPGAPDVPDAPRYSTPTKRCASACCINAWRPANWTRRSTAACIGLARAARIAQHEAKQLALRMSGMTPRERGADRSRKRQR